MKNGRMQCKDISNERVLAAVEVIIRAKGYEGATANLEDLIAELAGPPGLMALRAAGIYPDVDYDALMPYGLVIAKVRKLVRRGLLDGCYCGCGGHLILTETFVVKNTIYPRPSPLLCEVPVSTPLPEGRWVAEEPVPGVTMVTWKNDA